MKKIQLGLRGASILSILIAASLTKAQAANIDLTGSGNGLYNTGVEVDDMTPIAADPTGDNNPADPHYSVSYYVDGAGGKPVVFTPPAVYTPGFFGVPTYTGTAYVASPLATASIPGDNWVQNLPDAQWISYSPDTTNIVPNTPNTGVTVYQLVLTDIPTGDEITLNAQIAADDNVTIYADGKQLFSNFGIGDDGTNSQGNYNQYTTVDGMKFASGTTNTLDFVVYNNGSYSTGLSAKLTGSYTTVPEPSTYAMLALGLGVLFFTARRKAAVHI